MVFIGDLGNKNLSEKVAKKLGIKVSYPDIHIFSDGERRVRILQKVAGKKVLVLKSLSPPVDSNIIEFCFIVDAVKRNGADEVFGIIPYLGYSRADHMFRTGEGVPLEVVIKIIEGVGVNKVLLVDPHSIKIPELFKIPVVDISALEIFAEKIRELLGGRPSHISNDARQPSSQSQIISSSSLSESQPPKKVGNSEQNTGLAFNSFESGQAPAFTLVSPDMGGIRRVKILSEMLDKAPIAVINKDRDLETGEITGVRIAEGKVGKTCFIIDDMISTGKTITEAVDFLIKKGAEEIYVFATHPVFSENAPSLLQNSEVKKVFVTDTIAIPGKKQFKKLEVLSVDEIIADRVREWIK